MKGNSSWHVAQMMKTVRKAYHLFDSKPFSSREYYKAYPGERRFRTLSELKEYGYCNLVKRPLGIYHYQLTTKAITTLREVDYACDGDQVPGHSA